jgi:hypothetical protein
MNDTSKVTLVEPRVYEASVVKEKPFEEEEIDHCFVCDMSKSHGGGWYSDGSCIELPFS